MFLYKCRIKGNPINHPLAGHDKLDPLILESLVVRLRCGDTEAIEPIVKSHIKLLINISGQYAAATNDSYGHELVSEAVLAAVKACNEHERLHDCNITGYIICCVHSALKDYIRRDSVVRIPYQERGKPAKQLNHDVNKYRHPFELVELNELIDKSIESNIEREVINLRREGHTDLEIAEKLKISDDTVRRHRTNVYKRFNERNR